MAQFTINVPDDKVTDLVAAFAKAYRYDDQFNGHPDPPTKAQFAKQQLLNYMKSIYKNYKREEAREAAELAANDAAIVEADTFTAA